MSSLSQREVTDKLIKEMAILMLSLKERDPAFGNEAAWDYIATELIGENDRKAVLHYLKGETRPLVCLGTESIRIASNGAKELLSLLRNTNMCEALRIHVVSIKGFNPSYDAFLKEITNWIVMNLRRLGKKLSTLEKALSSGQGRRIWRVQPLETQMAEEIVR